MPPRIVAVPAKVLLLLRVEVLLPAFTKFRAPAITPPKLPPPIDVSVACAPVFVTVPPEPARRLLLLRPLTTWLLPLRSSVPWFTTRLVVVGVMVPGITARVLAALLVNFTVPELITKLLPVKYCGMAMFSVPPPVSMTWFVV